MGLFFIECIAFREQERIKGVSLKGNIWIIPKDAERPTDMICSDNKQKDG